MIFTQTNLAGVFEIRIEPSCDERGFFARSWCRREFESHGLNSELDQCNISFKTYKGTLRGMHFQDRPSPEVKLVRCTRGRIFDVIVDLRSESLTFKKWVGITLSDDTRNMVYIPEGCAHGFLTLDDRTEVFYQMSEFYRPDLARGVRWDDPAFSIRWPDEVHVMSERDRTYPDFES